MFDPRALVNIKVFNLNMVENSSANLATGFIDFRNNLNIPDAHMFVDHGTDGSSAIIFGNTPAGDRTSDRRTERSYIFLMVALESIVNCTRWGSSDSNWDHW